MEPPRTTEMTMAWQTTRVIEYRMDREHGGLTASEAANVRANELRAKGGTRTKIVERTLQVCGVPIRFVCLVVSEIV